MTFRALFHAFLLPAICLGLSSTPVHASNPLKALGSGIKKVSGNLNPFKKPKAAPVEKPPAKPVVKAAAAKPAAKPLAKTTKAAKAAPGAKPAKGQTLASAKPKAKSGKPGSATTMAAAGAGAAGAAGPEKPAGPSSADTRDSSSGDEKSTSALLPEPAMAAAPPADIPFATPVMGRKGHVRSPFAEDQGMVDVSDIPAGTKVRCPYTGKVFRVP